MNRKSVGFIGGGRIVRIILGGWERAGFRPGPVVVADPSGDALARLKQEHQWVEVVEGEPGPASRQDVVFLAVHPPAIADVAAKAAADLKPHAVVVSLAAKVTIQKLASLLGGWERLARTIPNAPSLVGMGYNPVAYGPNLDTDGRAAVQDLLAPLGECPEVDEDKLEAYAIITAMGPTYLWPQLYELEALAERFGLTAGEAARAVERMTQGALAVMNQVERSPQAVQDLIPVSPLREVMPTWLTNYQTALNALWEKIQP